MDSQVCSKATDTPLKAKIKKVIKEPKWNKVKKKREKNETKRKKENNQMNQNTDMNFFECFKYYLTYAATHFLKFKQRQHNF